MTTQHPQTIILKVDSLSTMRGRTMNISARSSSARLRDVLPPMFQHLANLPEEICDALLPMAHWNTGSGFEAIQANMKLKKLAAMSTDEVIAGWAIRAR